MSVRKGGTARLISGEDARVESEDWERRSLMLEWRVIVSGFSGSLRRWEG